MSEYPLLEASPNNVLIIHVPGFTNYSPTQPSYIPEYQGGAFDPYVLCLISRILTVPDLCTYSWGGYGFENCAQLTGNEFSDVFYKTLVAQKVSLINLYMTYFPPTLCCF